MNWERSMRRIAIAALLVGGLPLPRAATTTPRRPTTPVDGTASVGTAAAGTAPAGTSAAGGGAACAEGKTLDRGRALTIATGEPAFPPYVIDDAPEYGQGFEAAVAYAVAASMGFAPDQVTWTRTTFEGAIQPGPEGLRLQPPAVLDHRRSEPRSVSFSRAVLRRQPGDPRLRRLGRRRRRRRSPTSRT